MTTPTPRTDAVETRCKYPESFHYYSLLDHARQLERELIETKEKLAIAMRFAETRLEHINILTQK
jgi:hypothetical protein